ncbi:universal stress protein [Paraflavitalea pollutisoli]|uniref:universal stress protein n=1 Tax=Paraflavitalea pollutisoli TaxID=3034143 RepID=UPI0023ECB045|nr:universal stress protein [Paraflavitalea sp. H1-2-19X]
MRNVLIPTDFSVASIELVDKTAQTLEGESLNIILFHAFEIPFFVSDVFDLRGKLPYAELVTEPFRNACKRAKLQYPKTIRSIVIRHQYGSTAAVFRNFVDANDIDLIVCPDFFVFQSVHTGSVNPVAMFQKGGVPMMKEFKLKRKTAEESASKPAVAEPRFEEYTKEKNYAVKEEHPVPVHIRQNTV